jgi:hypothetical protein
VPLTPRAASDPNAANAGANSDQKPKNIRQIQEGAILENLLNRKRRPEFVGFASVALRTSILDASNWGAFQSHEKPAGGPDGATLIESVAARPGLDLALSVKGHCAAL